LQRKVDIKVANILDFDSFLDVLIEDYSSHIDETVLRLNLDLWPDPFALNFAAYSILFGEELDPLLEALFFYGLKLYGCLKGLPRLHFSQAIQNVEGAENRHALLLQLGFIA
jgi:hypothetical protein